MTTTHLIYRQLNGIKHSLYPEDVIPLWVADMDFPTAPAVVEALHERVSAGMFGYTMDNPELREVIAQRLGRLYGWAVEPGHVLFVPGLVSAFSYVGRHFGAPGGALLMQPPIYPPFLGAPAINGQTVAPAPLVAVREGARLRYEIDFDALETQAARPETQVFLFCNPHNPVGRVYTRAELERIAEICLRHDVLICSDEIHADLIYDDHQHIPMATLSPEVESRTVTLMAPSKTFNIAGLACAYAVIPNADLRQRFFRSMFGEMGLVNALGYVAALAAYRHGEPWLRETLAVLQANRDTVTATVEASLPDVAVTHAEGTYLAWLDLSAYPFPDGDAHRYMVEHARVALSNGKDFGTGGEAHLRLNFATHPDTLAEALERIRGALAALGG